METTEMTVMDLPSDTDMDTLLLEIPEDCKQLYDDKLKQAYFVSMHANGNGLFVSKDLNRQHRQIFPVYPSENNPLRDWKVISYQRKSKK